MLIFKFFQIFSNFSGPKRPIFVVGNKVDLLPQDSDMYLMHIKQCLKDSVVNAGFNEKRIKNVSLISAKTNFGIEDLIADIQKQWGSKGEKTHSVSSDMRFHMLCSIFFANLLHFYFSQVIS